MKLWSRGLGRTEVLMDFRRYKVVSVPDSDEVCIIGSMQDPVNWEFRITLGAEDVPGMMKMVFNVTMLKLIFKNLHRYIYYLLNRHQYIDKNSEDLEIKVNRAYEQMMNPRRPKDRVPATETIYA